MIEGKLLNADGHPISNARIYFSENPNQKVKTDQKGKFYIGYVRGDYDTLRIEHVGYNDLAVYISKKSERRISDDTLFLNLTMQGRALPEIDIVYRTQRPDTLFGTQEYSVEDFEFDKHGNLILLTYEKNLQSGSVLKLIGSDNEILDNFYVPGLAVELQKDFRNNIHLITKDKIFLIQIMSQHFEVYEENPHDYYAYIAPIMDTMGSTIFFSNYSEVYPAFDYFAFNRDDSVYTHLLKIEDTLMMEFYLAEFKYVDVRTKLWAHQKQLETGIDKEIWVGATVFTNSLYYNPLYAPLFKVGSDSILLFDHYTDQLFIYTDYLTKKDSLPIFYHKFARKSGWAQPLIQDEGNGKIYAMFDRNGYTYLHEIDPKTGLIKDSFKLYFRYTERIQIKNDEVMYIYRPYESIQKKYIYRERFLKKE